VEEGRGTSCTLLGRTPCMFAASVSRPHEGLCCTRSLTTPNRLPNVDRKAVLPHVTDRLRIEALIGRVIPDHLMKRLFALAKPGSKELRLRVPLFASGGHPAGHAACELVGLLRGPAHRYNPRSFLKLVGALPTFKATGSADATFGAAPSEQWACSA